MPPVGNIFTPLKVVDTTLLPPLEEIIEASIEDATTMFEFGPCDIPGVGIIVPIGDELTSWGYCWLRLFIVACRRKRDKRLSSVSKFMYSS